MNCSNPECEACRLPRIPISVGAYPASPVSLWIVVVIMFGLALSVGALISGCGGEAPSMAEEAAIPGDAGPDGPGDASLTFTYCDTTMPENQTKFWALTASRSPDGSTCQISYFISFGTVSFTCSCLPVDECQKIGASLAAEAAACLAGDAGLEAGQ